MLSFFVKFGQKFHSWNFPNCFSFDFILYLKFNHVLKSNKQGFYLFKKSYFKL